MRLRKYRTSDCGHLAELFYHTVHSVNAKDYTKEQLDAWATGIVDLNEWDKSFLKHHTVVAVENNEIVGFGDMDPSGYLDRLYVHPDHQGEGTASAICDELESSVRGKKLTTHSSITARAFFEHRGYRVIQEQTVIRNGISLTNYIMEKYACIKLRERPELIKPAAAWFHGKWGVPTQAYLACMDAYLRGETEYGWYLCLDGGKIVGGLGVIENDFHDRKDLAPNICAVYTEKDHRCRGIAGRLLNMAVEDMRARGITPIYLITDHTGFYERYSWEFLCMVQGDGEPHKTRMYIHR